MRWVWVLVHKENEGKKLLIHAFLFSYHFLSIISYFSLVFFVASLSMVEKLEKQSSVLWLLFLQHWHCVTDAVFNFLDICVSHLPVIQCFNCPSTDRNRQMLPLMLLLLLHHLPFVINKVQQYYWMCISNFLEMNFKQQERDRQNRGRSEGK